MIAFLIVSLPLAHQLHSDYVLLFNFQSLMKIFYLFIYANTINPWLKNLLFIKVWMTKSSQIPSSFRTINFIIVFKRSMEFTFLSFEFSFQISIPSPKTYLYIKRANKLLLEHSHKVWHTKYQKTSSMRCSKCYNI